MHSRRLFTAVALASLLGCAQAPSRRLAAAQRPLDAVRLYVWAGKDGVLQRESLERLARTLQLNGLPVEDGPVWLDRPLADVAALQRSWNGSAHLEGASHALVLTRQRLDSFGGANYVRYEAVLWEAGSHALVWQATLASAVNDRSVDRARRGDMLAGDVLRGLSRDHLFELRGGVPRDDSGSEIPATLVPLQLR